MMLTDKKIVIGVCGGIAAYKAAEICSLLKKAGAQVRVAMSHTANKFVGALTFETLTGHPVYENVVEGMRAYEMEHISWTKWADVFLVAPATANVLAKMACGIADDPVTALYLSFSGPVFVAPAMNTNMLEHPATQTNINILRQRGVKIIESDSGMLACGDVGKGRLAIPEFIVQTIAGGPVTAVVSSAAALQAEEAPPLPGDDSFSGKKVLITSGPTHEYLDPVRFLTNPSSGKMGFALAREAARRGAEVHFVTGPVGQNLLPANCAKIYRVTSADQMHRSVAALAPDMDVMIFAAAVSDFRAATPVHQKIKRTGNSISLPLVENPDIAQAIGHTKREGQITVGFAAETQEMENNALAKLERKRLDAIVANDVANPRIGFDRDENEVTIFLRDGSRAKVSRRPKSEVAHEIFDVILTKLM